MKTKEENMGKEKELLSDEELLEVAAGKRIPGNLPHDATPEEIRIEHCVRTCMDKGNNMDKCQKDCGYSNRH
ncbi:MAG: hypothetical protein RRZ65_04575 [Tannerellaceae bacterium]